MTHRSDTSLLAILVLFFSSCTPEPTAPEPITVQLLIENVSTSQTFTSSGGEPIHLALAPGVYATSAALTPFFTPDAPASAPLEALAEAGDPSPMLEALRADPHIERAGLTGDIDNPTYEEDPILPGKSTLLTFTYVPGEERLFFAMMIGNSNDVFLAPRDPRGLDLERLPEGELDVSALLLWWNAGTEIDEPLGQGMFQPATAPGTESGTPEGGVIHPSALTSSTGERLLPAVEQVVRVKLTRR